MSSPCDSFGNLTASTGSITNSFRYTVVHEAYRPGRLIDYAAMPAVIASALLLRQIREQLRNKT